MQATLVQVSASDENDFVEHFKTRNFISKVTHSLTGFGALQTRVPRIGWLVDEPRVLIPLRLTFFFFFFFLNFLNTELWSMPDAV